MRRNKGGMRVKIEVDRQIERIESERKKEV